MADRNTRFDWSRKVRLLEKPNFHTLTSFAIGPQNMSAIWRVLRSFNDRTCPSMKKIVKKSSSEAILTLKSWATAKIHLDKWLQSGKTLSITRCYRLKWHVNCGYVHNLIASELSFRTSSACWDVTILFQRKSRRNKGRKLGKCI